MLSQLEVYALKCYNRTAEHKANVIKLESIDEMISYDYTIGYPDKLTFTIEYVKLNLPFRQFLTLITMEEIIYRNYFTHSFVLIKFDHLQALHDFGLLFRLSTLHMSWNLPVIFNQIG